MEIDVKRRYLKQLHNLLRSHSIFSSLRFHFKNEKSPRSEKLTFFFLSCLLPAVHDEMSSLLCRGKRKFSNFSPAMTRNQNRASQSLVSITQKRACCFCCCMLQFTRKISGWCLFRVSLYQPSSRQQHNTINLKAKNEEKHKVTSARLPFFSPCFVCKDIFLVIWLALLQHFYLHWNRWKLLLGVISSFSQLCWDNKTTFFQAFARAVVEPLEKKSESEHEKMPGIMRRAHGSDGVGLSKWWKLIFCDFAMQSSFTRRTSFKAPFNDVASLSLCLCFFLSALLLLFVNSRMVSVSQCCHGLFWSPMRFLCWVVSALLTGCRHHHGENL